MTQHSVLVVGGGVAGLQVSIDLAGMGMNVVLVDSEPRMGGHASLLHQVFPTLDNAEELTKQLLRKVLCNPNIRILSYSEIKSVKGSSGNFKAATLKKARYVDEAKCTNCGECGKVCPVEVLRKFEIALAKRKAIYLPSLFAVPATYLIDKSACLYFNDKSCRACQDACPEGAVIYSQKDSHEELSIDIIVLATGFQQYDAQKVGQYKYGVFPNVITGMEYERLCSSTGLTSGKILRIGNKERLKSVVFILCVGSRDEKHLRYCCSIGCLNAIKHATYLKSMYGQEVDVYVCYTDVRAITKHGEQFYQKARASGVEFIHGQPSEVRKTLEGSLSLDVYDQATSKLLSITADIVVLEIGLSPRIGLRERLELILDEDGFIVEKHPQLAPNETLVDGVFLAGAVQQPMHIEEALVNASAAAMRVLFYVRKKVPSEGSESN